MKRFTFYFLLSTLYFLLLSCSSQTYLIDQQVEKPQTFRVYTADFNAVWKNTMAALQSYPITTVDKESGVIATDWRFSQQTRTVSVNRGLAFGGRVTEDMPIDVLDRVNALIQYTADGVRVDVSRAVRVRPYLFDIGPAGTWKQDVNGNYVETSSDGKTEKLILDAVEYQLARM